MDDFGGVMIDIDLAGVINELLNIQDQIGSMIELFELMFGMTQIALGCLFGGLLALAVIWGFRL